MSFLNKLKQVLLPSAVVKEQTGFINHYIFPQTLNEKVLEKYPHLTETKVEKVIEGLREYFHICNLAGEKMVSMPSQVVDVAWHEFILFTRDYKSFCESGLGRFLHHVPAEAMKAPTMAQEGIQRAWKISCDRENISVSTPEKLPVLFAIDKDLAIPDGFEYGLDCKKTGDKYCASHIGCSSCGGESHSSHSAKNTSNKDSDDSDGGSDGGSSCSSCGGD